MRYSEEKEMKGSFRQALWSLIGYLFGLGTGLVLGYFWWHGPAEAWWLYVIGFALLTVFTALFTKSGPA